MDVTYLEDLGTEGRWLADMTTVSPVLDLDDADALIVADSDGALRSAALAGAQVRASAASFDDVVGDRLRDLRPRSVVFVSGAGRSSRASSFLVAAVAPRIGVPLVRASVTPPWVGPLDVVVVAGDDAGDPRLAESTAAAVRRGAETILVTPDEGPLRSAAAGRAFFLPPRIAVREHNMLMRYVAAGICVLGAVADGVYGSALPDLGRLADRLDDEAAQNHPLREVFRNPAKSVATRMAGKRIVFTGIGAAATDTARHSSEIMLRAAGAVTAAGEISEVVAAAIAVRDTGSASPADYDPFFHDDQVDGPRPEAGVRVLVLAPSARTFEAERRTAALPEVDLLIASPPQTRATSDAGHVTSPTHDPGDSAASGLDDVESMAILATRLELSAAYLHLMGGQ